GRPRRAHGCDPRRGPMGRGGAAAAAAALGGGAALRGRPAPPRDRGGDRLLGGGRAPLVARGPEQVERGDAPMRNRTSESNTLESALRGTAPAGGAAERPEQRRAAEAAARLTRRIAEEGLADVSYTSAESPFGTLRLAATRRGLVRLAFPEESVEEMLEGLARRVS